MNELNKREYYEDLFHDIVCKMLPKFKRSNIRPTYQNNGGRAVVNHIVDGVVVSVNGFTANSNIIYITVTFDNDTFNSYIEDDGSTSVTRRFNVKFTAYGNQSQQVALIIWSLIRNNQFLYELESKGIFLESNGSINQMYEEINGEIWERRDVNMRFNENVSIPVPSLDKVVVIGNGSVEVTTDGKV